MVLAYQESVDLVQVVVLWIYFEPHKDYVV